MSKSPEANMLKINETNVYNLTGKTIRLWDGVEKEFIAIPSNGVAMAHRKRDLHKIDATISGTTARITVIENNKAEWFSVDPASDWATEDERASGNWYAIVSLDYIEACEALGIPTEHFFTVGEPWKRETWTTIQGYTNLIKR